MDGKFMTTIIYPFKSLNAYIKDERTPVKGRYIASANKKRETEVVRLHFLKHRKITKPCKIYFTWILENKRTDLDNIAFSKKSILDGMVKANVLEDDSLKYVRAFEDTFIMGNKKGVQIRIEEIE